MLTFLTKIKEIIALWWSEFTLQTKLMAAATLVVSLIMSSLTFWAVNTIQLQSNINDTRFGSDLSILIASNAAPLVAEDDLQALSDFSTRFYRSTSSIRYIIYADQYGNIFFGIPYSQAEFSNSLTIERRIELPENYAQNSDLPFVRQHQTPNGQVTDVFVPLRLDGEYLGVLAVGINPNPGPILGYSFPDDPLFINGPIEMDSVTGLITWNTPNEAGIYNISYVVEEYRNGNLLGYVQRDMAVFVLDCDNEPPVIETITDTCVTAGDFLEFEFKAWDPDSADEIYLDLNNGPDGNNGPFRVDDPATLSGFIRRPEGDTIVDFTDLPVMSTNDGDGSTPVDTIIGEFNWQTTCDHIRIGFYQVDFFASDDLDRGSFDIGSSTTTLTANKVVQIRVIPPSPEDLFLAKGNRSIELTWLPPDCPDLVRGYFIYRKVDGAAYQQDTVCCEDNPATAGFELIGTNAGLQNINFTDDLLDIDGGFGTEICYAVTAV
ncbi:MAG: hypothetical protein AAFV78_12215, partial [Bacteroidota bacterium]